MTYSPPKPPKMPKMFMNFRDVDHLNRAMIYVFLGLAMAGITPIVIFGLLTYFGQ